MASDSSTAVLYGLIGAGSALILSSMGAAYGTAKAVSGPKSSNSGSRYQLVGTNDKGEELNLVNEGGVQYPATIVAEQSTASKFIPFIPIIIAGVLAIYGLIYSVIVLQATRDSENYSYSRGYNQLVGGLTLGFCCLASGIAVGIVGKKGLHAIAQNDQKAAGSLVKMIINLVYCEALGLYGLIFGIIAASSA